MRAKRWRSVYARSTNRAKIAKSSRDPDRTAGKLSVPMQRSTNPQVREAPRRASAKEISGLIKISALIPRAALSSCNKIKIKYRRGCGALGRKRTTSMRRSVETDEASLRTSSRARLKEEPVAPRASLKQNFPHDATAPWTGKAHRFHGVTYHLKTRRKTTMKIMREIHVCFS